LSNILISYYTSPVGEIVLGTYENKLCLADWRYRKMRTAIDARIQKGLNAEYKEGEDKTLRKAVSQLDEYFAGERREFDVPLELVGTQFQKQVWNALVQIPFGKTETYLGLSWSLGNEKAIRAVATANGANAVSIIIPCHRIIGSDGSLVGYAGGLPAKKKLLALENPDRERQLGLF